MKTTRPFAFLLILSAILLGGCTSVPMASPEKDVAAKTFTTKPDKANIYVYRNESMGGAIKLAVTLDGRLAADTGPKTYMLLEVPAGKHTIESKSENSASLTIDAVNGKNYFVWQEIKMGFVGPRSALNLVDENTGKAGVAECKLVQ